MEFKYLIVRKEDGVGWLKMNRPPMNALSTEVVLEIEQIGRASCRERV